MNYFLYTILSLTLAVFIHDFLIIPIKIRIKLYKAIRIIKKMKKKYTDEATIKTLDDVIFYLKQSYKNDKLNNDED